MFDAVFTKEQLIHKLQKIIAEKDAEKEESLSVVTKEWKEEKTKLHSVIEGLEEELRDAQEGLLQMQQEVERIKALERAQQKRYD